MTSNPKKKKSLLDTVLFAETKKKLDESEALSHENNQFTVISNDTPSPSFKFTENIADTNNRGNELLHEQPNNWASERATGQQNRQTTGHSPGHSPERVPKQPNEQPNNWATGQDPEQPNNRTTERTTGQQNNKTTERAPGQPGERITEQAISYFKAIEQIDFHQNKPKNLNDKQYRILEYVYFNRPFKVKGENGIEGLLGIKYNTVRNSLRSLEVKGYIEKPFAINDGVYNGSNCRVNTDLCLTFFGPSQITQPTTLFSGQPDNRTTGRTTGQPNNKTPERATEQPIKRASERTPEQPSERTTDSYSSSSFLNNTTTITELDLSDPYLFYWLENGLTVDQINKWVMEFKHSPTMIINFLKWAKFDLVDNDIEKNIDKSVLKWFYGALKKGGYSKPVNYKSHQQLLIEKETKELEFLEAEVKALNEVRKKKQELHLSLELERVLADPEGELYKKCLAAFPGIQKTRYINHAKQLGPAFEKEMGRALRKILYGDGETE